jgi:hypothetical protein
MPLELLREQAMCGSSHPNTLFADAWGYIATICHQLQRRALEMDPADVEEYPKSA